MKHKPKYILLLLFLPFLAFSQTNVVSPSTVDIFMSNLGQNAGILENGTGGKIHTQKDQIHNLTFSQKRENSKIRLYPKDLPLASGYYQLLTELNEMQKSNLVRAFSANEALFAKYFSSQHFSAEIEFLPPALSAMNRKAVGQDKRAGLWQLTHFQAVLHGLKISRLVDQRFDPGKSTEAAFAELKKLKEVFGSEELAVLAFLAGPVQVRNAQAASTITPTTDEILSRLPAKVSEQLAMWQAASVFLSENKWESGLEIPATDTVTITRRLHFQQVCTSLNIPIEILQNYNPQYPYSIVPGDEEPQILLLPAGLKNSFVLLQDSVYANYDSALFEIVAQKIEYAPAPSRQYLGEKVKDLEIEGKSKIHYTIKSGDVLGFIAEEYDVQVEDLKYWNNIYNERRIQAGQKLDIFVDDADAEYYRNLHPEPLTKSGAKNPAAAATFPIPANARKIEHEVKSGESPYVIAQKYKGVTPEAILYWNGISDARKIQIGQKLTIYVSE